MKAPKIKIEGEEFTLLPYDFLEKIGTIIINHNRFEHHIIVMSIYDLIENIKKRGFYNYLDEKKAEILALALSKKDIEFFKTEYNKVMENII